MNRTAISWCLNPDGTPGFTWNPVIGCSHMSVGCANCWAERLAGTRLAQRPEYKGLTDSLGRWTGVTRFLPKRLVEPLRRRKPAGIFVCDMGDLFHESVTNEQIAAVYGVMAACPQHRFYVLTKRPKRRREWFEWFSLFDERRHRADVLRAFIVGTVPIGMPPYWKLPRELEDRWPLPNVWEGTSIEDQATADERISELLQTPAAVRWVSAEPLLGPVNLASDAMPEWKAGSPELDWVVVGGESGPGARPCNAAWIHSVVEQCREAGVACWVKQIHDGKVIDNPELFPPNLRVRQMPEAKGERR